MRIWSLHPRYLDRQGLLAGWREGLLAQAVLLGNTKGYTNHPQLVRFRASTDPQGTIGTHLQAIADEAVQRGYRFDATKIIRSADPSVRLAVTDGQLDFERRHLLAKVLKRNPDDADRIASLQNLVEAHPLFDVLPGPVEEWERGSLD
ncbi:pyrimidine dimer DNA glycosylase/endonuclease V [Flaviflexus huanghaiensis]|uniref:pyrimidine dimer DNA glycosylase/endonuclease V n=1 Tax=Flaviflexus huanghaiensis TaxID=1111473 RepID=UPI0015FC8F11|nr:pyrimidine dimer DNA glycosylase/endonuclease V [Flaviflexus huanghaiensis]